MSDSLVKWLDRVSNEDAQEGVAKPVEDKNVKANLETAGAGEAGSEPTEEAAGNPDEIKVVAKESEGGEEAGGGPAAGPEEAAPLTTGSDGGANAGEATGGAAPVAPIVPVDGEAGPKVAADGGMAAAAQPVVEPGPAPVPEATSVATPAVEPAVEPAAEPAAAAEPVVEPATEDAEPTGEAKPVEDKNVKANLETSGAGEAGSEASEEAAGNPDEIKVVAKEDAGTEPVSESAPAVGEAGEVEAIGVPAEFDLPETESETAVANRHMNEVADDLTRIDQVNTALEAYHELLTRSIADHGVVPPSLARSVQIGLEAFGEATLTDLLPAQEDFAVATTRTQASNRSVDAVQGKFKQMLEIARAAIKKLLEWLGDIYNSVTQDTGKMIAKLDEVKAKIDKITKTTDKRMVLNGVDRLSINGFFVGDTAAPIRVVNDTVEYFTQDYPKVLTKTVVAIKKGLNGFMQGHGVADQQLLSVISDAVADNLKFVGMPNEKAKADEFPSKFAKASAVSRSKVFPGNMALFYSLVNKDSSKAGLDENQAAAFQFSNIFQVEFARLANAKMMPSGGDGVKVPDQRVLKQMTLEVVALVGTLEDLKDAKAQNAVFAKEVEELGKDWYATNMGIAWISTGQQLMNGLAKAYSTPSGNLFGYVASLVKAYIALLDRFADHHMGSATHAEE